MEDFERMIDDFLPDTRAKPFDAGHPSWSHLPVSLEGRVPHVDVVDLDKVIYVEAELPGVDEKDVDITVNKYSLTIKGSTRTEEKKAVGDYCRSEIYHVTFSRTVSLPCEVNSDNSKVRFEDGILKLTFSKIRPAKHRSIDVE